MKTKKRKKIWTAPTETDIIRNEKYVLAPWYGGERFPAGCIFEDIIP
jgi:hypothetical protein